MLFRSVTVVTTGTVPTGLSLATAYWVYVVDANTIRLNSNRDLALAGTGIVPTAGAGTQSVIPGPASNLVIGYNGTILNNDVTGCRLDQSYESAVVLSGAKGNTVSGNELIDSWLGNTSQQSRPAVQELNGSQLNTLTGNEYFSLRGNGSVNDAVTADASSTSSFNFADSGTVSRLGMFPGDVMVFGGSYNGSGNYRGVFHCEPYAVEIGRAHV